MQKRWIDSLGLFWDSSKAQYSAQEMFRRIFEMKFLPPGRGLFYGGDDDGGGGDSDDDDNATLR